MPFLKQVRRNSGIAPVLRCVNVFFVGFEFVYTVVSNLRSVIVIRHLLNVIGLLSHDLLALSGLLLPS